LQTRTRLSHTSSGKLILLNKIKQFCKLSVVSRKLKFMLSYVEISKENLLHNFKVIKDFVHPEAKIAAVIKANAYGHGQNEIAELLENTVDYFQIDDLEELRLLRKVSQKPVLVLGYVSKDELEEAIDLDGTLSIYDEERLHIIEKIAEKKNKKADVHVKIDAYLGRQGVLVDQASDFIELIKKCKNINVKGIYCHFANIEDTSDFSHAQKQIDGFDGVIEKFRKAGFENFETHASATSGVLVYEQKNKPNTLIRPGIGSYGMWPSEELRGRFENDDFKLKPVLRWISRVAQVKTVPAGYSIGYGLTYITSKPTKIAIVPQGYSDGFDRGLSNVGEVLICGKRCQVLGRVAMNMFVVDVSHLDKIQQEDEIVLLGRQGDEEITAEEIAAHLGTINYEITTRISPLLTRVVQ